MKSNEVVNPSPPMQEWSHVDKSAWGPGAWQNEPDKVQWVDAATGLDCLIVRNNGGALCGYVGVPEAHPLHGISYNEDTEALGAALDARKERPVGENPGMGVLLVMLGGEVKRSPDIVFEVHGGLTFSDHCHDATPERFAKWREMMENSRGEAAKYPVGDAAQRLAKAGHLVDDYEGWCRLMESTAICHIPAEGRPGKVWWFGFDCAHAGDISPKYDSDSRLRFRDFGDVYRDREYVAGEVANLARQLAAVSA